MERPTRLFSALFLLFLLLATGMGPDVAEAARICESPSNRFRGICVSSSNCVAICQTEGFNGGQCKGFRRRCMCSKPCPAVRP